MGILLTFPFLCDYTGKPRSSEAKIGEGEGRKGKKEKRIMIKRKKGGERGGRRCSERAGKKGKKRRGEKKSIEREGGRNRREREKKWGGGQKQEKEKNKNGREAE